MTAPERSRAQRLDALERANEIRIYRARLKRDLKAGRQSIHPLLLKPPEWLLTAMVADMLLAVPSLGHVKVNKALKTCRISPTKTFGGLTERQRDELDMLLRRQAIERADKARYARRYRQERSTAAQRIAA